MLLKDLEIRQIGGHSTRPNLRSSETFHVSTESSLYATPVRPLSFRKATAYRKEQRTDDECGGGKRASRMIHGSCCEREICKSGKQNRCK